jgi:DNA-binding response OmpR family regulator
MPTGTSVASPADRRFIEHPHETGKKAEKMITQKILVVDDEEDICRSVTKILTRRGFAVDAALSAEDAVKRINQASFDLVITDLMMPKTDGLELLKIIRDHYPELDVLMITGYASIESAVRAVKLGAAGYLPKPFTPDELMSATSKALEGRKKMPASTAPQARHLPDDLLDVDMPFSAREVERQTSRAYVDALTHSDLPLAKKVADKEFCHTGKRMCVRLIKEKRECTPACPIEKKERERAARTSARPAVATRELIDVDLPFSIDEVEQATGPDYLSCLDRSDIPRAALYGRDATARHSVLVVDDEPVVCHSVRRILAKRRCAVDEAFDVDTVLQKMRLNNYDLVILDLKMPKRSGLEVLQSIREQYPAVPVVMISGYASIKDAIAATQLGASDFVQKPFTPNELLKATEEVLAA